MAETYPYPEGLGRRLDELVRNLESIASSRTANTAMQRVSLTEAAVEDITLALTVTMEASQAQALAKRITKLLQTVTRLRQFVLLQQMQELIENLESRTADQ